MKKVDRHPQFTQSRCFFVVRTDGVWEDFSYNKCLKGYLRVKYPEREDFSSLAKTFIEERGNLRWSKSSVYRALGINVLEEGKEEP